MSELVIRSKTVISDTQSIIKHLWGYDTDGEMPDVYAILDGARDRRISSMVYNSSLKHESMYSGELSYELQCASPHIVKLTSECKLTQQIIELGWGNSWCIFAIVHAPSSFSKVRYNCKKIAYIEDPVGKKLLFRYYDPRVMRVFLPTCTAEEAALVFGPVSEIVMEGEDSTKMIRFAPGEAIKNIPRSALVSLRGKSGLLKIRPSQIEAFKQNKLERFENRAVEYLKKHFPARCAELGEVSVVESVRDCVSRCKEYGIEIEQDIVYYLYYMYTIDFDFDQNDNAWAKRTLQQKNLNVRTGLEQIRMRFKAEAGV